MNRQRLGGRLAASPSRRELGDREPAGELLGRSVWSRSCLALNPCDEDHKRDDRESEPDESSHARASYGKVDTARFCQRFTERRAGLITFPNRANDLVAWAYSHLNATTRRPEAVIVLDGSVALTPIRKPEIRLCPPGSSSVTSAVIFGLWD